MPNIWKVLAIAGTLFILSGRIGLAQEATPIRIGGDPALQPILDQALADYAATHPGVTFEIVPTDATAGMTALSLGGVAIAMLAREPNNAERLAMPDLVLDRIGTEAIAFAVHSTSTLQRITRDQARDLFLGRIQNWKELGAGEAPVVRLCRSEGRASWGWLLECLGLEPGVQSHPLLDRAFVKLPGKEESEVEVRFCAADQDPMTLLRNEVYGLACVPLTTNTMTAAAEGSVRLLELQGVAPTEDNVRKDIYPFRRPLILATKATAPAAVIDFKNWLLSPEGQKVVARFDAIPVQTGGP
jgi:phosphate transport system substrate-binding protein